MTRNIVSHPIVTGVNGSVLALHSAPQSPRSLLLPTLLPRRGRWACWSVRSGMVVLTSR
jgi:hypothetical protein